MTENTQQKSWFSRNWLWFVPVSGCLGIILLFALGIGGLIFGVTKMISGSEPYQYALERAETNEKLIRVIGETIETDGIMNGNISLENEDGSADFTIPIKGPKGKARIIVVAKKSYGDWIYEELYIQIKDTKEQINLLDKSSEGF